MDSLALFGGNLSMGCCLNIHAHPKHVCFNAEKSEVGILSLFRPHHVPSARIAKERLRSVIALERSSRPFVPFARLSQRRIRRMDTGGLPATLMDQSFPLD